jgi:Phage integrase family
VPSGVKNCNRIRGVPLNDTALAAAEDLLAQAKSRGVCEPEHFLIPFRVKKGTHDPKRAASSCFIRSAFRSIAKACGLAWVTPSTFRHQAITKLLESGAPDETVPAIAGHGSERAMKYYSHIRMEAKKEALDRLVPREHLVQRIPSHKRHREFPLLNQLRTLASNLGIETDAALELVLGYEKAKATGFGAARMMTRARSSVG